MAKKTLKDLKNLKGKKVVLRVDYNVPINNGIVSDNKRITASLPTIKYILQQGASIILLSHLSRCEKLEDITSGKKSLKPAFLELRKLLPKVNVKFVDKNTGTLVDNSIKELKPKEILFLENTRYNDVEADGTFSKKESKADESLGKYWASLGDVFVNDAFGVAHRAAASNTVIAKNAPESAIGFLIEQEVTNLSKITTAPKKPVVAILGGAKISDKIGVIENMLKLVDKILICGGMANTFLCAKNYNLGKSLAEVAMLDTAKKILDSDKKKKIVLPVDFMCGTAEFKDQTAIAKTLNDKFDNLAIYDIGSKTVDLFSNELVKAKTVFWNGPAGVFEFKNFANGTKQICTILKKITKNGAFTLIGGGDSASAAINLGFKEKDFSFISTGGGASLEFIEGKKLPGIEAISNKK